MKIIFLNAWEGTQKEALRQYLIDESPTTDIFCFQEYLGPVIEISKEILADYNSIQDEKYVDKKENYQQATFVKKNLEILRSEILFKDDPELGLAIFTEVAKDGNQLSIVNVHGIPYPGDKLDTGARIRQTTSIIDFLQDKKTPHIIGGDFNLDPHTESIKLFEKAGYKNLIADYKIDTTRNPLAWASWPDNIQLFADYAFVSSEIDIKQFSVPKNEVSDHLPLVLEI
jgi:endonuclease/exonuclease/phosphatase family metal-dependent hydrolase